MLAVLPALAWEIVIYHAEWPDLVKMTTCNKEIGEIATKALYKTIILNNESTAERFIALSISAVDKVEVQRKLGYIQYLDLLIRPSEPPFVLSRLSNVPALSSKGEVLFPNLRAMYIQNFVQPLTLHGWEQREEISFLEGVRKLEISVSGKRAIGLPAPSTPTIGPPTREDLLLKEAASWVLSLHPYGLIGLTDIYINLDYEWLCRSSVEALLGKQDALEYITLDMSSGLRIAKYREQAADKYWSACQLSQAEVPSWESRQEAKQERRERTLDALISAANRLHKTYRLLAITGGIKVSVHGDTGNALGHMYADRVRRQQSETGQSRQVHVYD